ncbi:MAG: RimK/LysX family protein [Pseudomonadota bacterium]|nr:RimK/LysX family protein [Pseudomonadota bacterium]
MSEKIRVGWREWLALPALAVPAVKAKIDTGARTSALHVFDLERFSDAGRCRVRFRLHPLQRRADPTLTCTAEVVDERWVRDSGGHPERRLVICTGVRLGGLEWPIEITLTNREDMLFRLLLGRTALAGRFIIDPELSFLTGRPRRGVYGQRPPKPR